MTTQPVDARTKEELDNVVAGAFEKHRAGRFNDAFAAYSQVLRVMPNHHGALHYMGLLAQQSGKPRQAAQLIERSLEINKENPDALNHLGQVYIALNNYAAAEKCFRQAIELNKHHFHAINNLANCFKKAGNLKTALIHYERALEIEPANPIAVYNIGNTLNALGRHWDAVEWLTKATSLQPRNYVAHHKLGLSLEQLGRFDDARANYLTALAYCPTFYASLAALLSTPSYQPTPQQVEAAQRALAEGELSADARMKLEHALGKHFDQAGDFDTAFSHFRNSKALQQARSAPFDIGFVTNEFDSFIRFYTAENIERLSRLGNQSQRPVFVVGMPRTGTTLTEQVLSSHSDVYGAGELKLMQQIESRLMSPIGKGGLGGLTAQPPPLNRESIDYLARIYLKGIDEIAPPDAVRVVDKFPLNCVHLGLIAILFPKARIIHCRRDPLDVALSCYTVLFKMDNDFTGDLRHFAQFYKEYERLMTHWRAVLQTPIFDLQYETLVRDPEPTVRRLMDFCELPWQDACLRFADNERAVRTPSNWQVRQEIYATSIRRWKHYERHLTELRELLGT